MGARCPRGHLGLLSAHDQVVASLASGSAIAGCPAVFAWQRLHHLPTGAGSTWSLRPPLLHCLYPARQRGCRLGHLRPPLPGTHCPPRTDGERAPPCCRPCLPPLPLAVLRYRPRHLAAFPPAAGAPRAPPMGVEPPPPRWVRWRAPSSLLGLRERARALACSPLGCGPKLATVQRIPGPAVRWLCYLMVWRWSVLLQSLRPLGLAGCWIGRVGR